MNRRITIAAALGLSALLALGACGRKGDLEPPPNVSPDMAAKQPACATPRGLEGRPVDTTRSPMIPSGNPTQIPENAVPGC